MKTILVKPSNETRISALLTEAQPRAQTRVMDYRDLSTAARQAEQRLTSLGIPKKYRAGVYFYASTDEAMSRAYKYRVAYTYARLIRRLSGWALVPESITRAERFTGDNPPALPALYLTPDQYDRAWTHWRTSAGIQRALESLTESAS